MSVIDSVYRYEDQLASNWDLQIDSPEGAVLSKIKYKVISTSIPFQKFQVERKKSGETIFKGVEEADTFTITLRESPDFTSFLFFQTWMDLFYDRIKRVFRVFPSEALYWLSLYNVQITFYRDNFIPSGVCLATFCKPVGIETLSLDYSGNPLVFTVTLQPERIVLL